MEMPWLPVLAAVALAAAASASSAFRSSLLVLGEEGLSERAAGGDGGASRLLAAVRDPGLRHPFGLWAAAWLRRIASGILAGWAGAGFALSAGGWQGATAAGAWILVFLLLLFFFETLSTRLAMDDPRAVLGRGRACLLAVRLSSVPARLFDRTGRVLFGDRYSPEALMDIRSRSEEGILDVIEEGAEHGTIDPAEEKMIERILSLGETTVLRGMTPWSEVVSLREGMAFADVARVAGETGFSRYPVVSAKGGEVVGILSSRTLFRPEVAAEWVRHLEKPTYVPGSMKIGDLLRQFQRTRVHMAVVIDERGKLCGLATVHDLMEKIAGRLSEGPGLPESPEWEKDGALSVPATTPVSTLRAEYGIDIPASDDYGTAAGFVMDCLQDVPEGAVTFLAHGYRISVVETERYRIKRIRFERTAPTGTT